MNLLDGIKYVFQIPFEWFKRVDARVFGDHPGTGVQFIDSLDGSRAISLDLEYLDDRYSSGEGGGGAPDDAVTISGTQTITGSKTFTNRVAVSMSAGDAQLGSAGVWLYRGSNAPAVRFYESGATSSSAVVQLNDSGVLEVRSWGAGDGVSIHAAANKAVLGTAPTQTAEEANNSKAIATTGWVASRFVSSSGLTANKWLKTDSNGKVVPSADNPIVASSSSTGLVYNASGTISYKPIGTDAGSVAAGNHTHSNYAAKDHTHSNYAPTTHSHSSLTTSSAPDGKRYVVFAKNATTSSLAQIFATELTLASADANNRQYVYFNKSATKSSTVTRIPIEDIDGAGIAGHSGKCLVVVDNDGNLSHSFNNMYNIVDQVKDLDDDEGNFGAALSAVVGDYISGPSGDGSSKGIPYTTKKAEAPSRKTTMNPSSVSNDSASWTNNGSNGLSINMVTRTMWDSSSGKLYQYTRTMTYSDSGQLQAVSAETRTEIDTPTIIKWK